ncbi:MAG TPA: hypothetical protein QF468_00140 [Nitrospinota bacterium]|jgi:hypothetical protein|nr:hypothetical protein [Nitrospinota bacterium]|tara:strand:+ start:685 stop:1062 length:378 start_codon:yes stop_codon:yes gene_type:complete
MSKFSELDKDIEVLYKELAGMTIVASRDHGPLHEIQTRASAITAKAAIESSKIQRKLNCLTIWLVVLTSLLIALTVFQFYVSIYVPAYLSPKTNPKTNTIIQKETQNKENATMKKKKPIDEKAHK